VTRDDILKMEAGPEMNALISSVVLKQGEYIQHTTKLGTIQHVIKIPSGDLVLPDNHSTDIAAAWYVVEKMRTQGRIIMLVFDEEVKVEYLDNKPIPLILARADTAPLAICRAALLATVQS